MTLVMHTAVVHWFNPATTLLRTKALVSLNNPVLFGHTLQWLFFPFKLSNVEDNAGKNTFWLPYCRQRFPGMEWNCPLLYSYMLSFT